MGKFRPSFNNILVRPEEQSKTEEGILLPLDSQKQEALGTVVAIGPGRINNNGTSTPVWELISVGVRVCFKPLGVDKVHIDNEELYIVNEEKILGIIE